MASQKSRQENLKKRVVNSAKCLERARRKALETVLDLAIKIALMSVMGVE